MHLFIVIAARHISDIVSSFRIGKKFIYKIRTTKKTQKSLIALCQSISVRVVMNFTD